MSRLSLLKSNIEHVEEKFFLREVKLEYSPNELGINFGTFDQYKSRHPNGAFIVAIKAGSVASNKQLLVGDYIQSIDGQNATEMSADQVKQAIMNKSSVTLVVDCCAVAYLQMYTITLLKVRDEKLFERQYFINQQGTRLCWKSKIRKGLDATFKLSEIKEVRMGRETSSFKRSYDEVNNRKKAMMGGPDADRCLSLIYGEGHEVLDACCPDEQDYHAFLLAMQYFVRENRQFALSEINEDPENARDKWLMDLFDQADTNNDKQLSLDEIRVLLQSLNLHLPDRELRRRFFNADRDKKGDEGYGLLDQKEFAQFYKALTVRPDIGAIMIKYGTSTKDRSGAVSDKVDTFDDVTMTADQFHSFLSHQQNEQVGLDECQELIKRYEPTGQGVFTIEGFTRFLTGNECEIFNKEHSGQVYQDMTRPLAHYFINSSHNTYLTDDQLVGPSDTEAYVRSLLNGCRCVEIDCWDGENAVNGVFEPVVFHGHTLTSKILFKDVCTVIAKYAFTTSDFPLILSIENHCSPEQQKLMVKHIKDTMGDYLHVIDFNVPALPSPLELKRKILIKGKRMKPTFQIEGVSDDDDDAGGTEDSTISSVELKGQPRAVRKKLKAEAKKKTAHAKVTPELAAMISFMGTKFKESHFELDDSSKLLGQNIQELAPSVMSSFVEAKAERLCGTERLAREFIQRNCRQLARVYPSGLRVSSSNYDPQQMWNAGCQIVALNFQTPGKEMALYLGKFRDNGGCGYVLKPDELTSPDTTFDPCLPATIDPSFRRTLTIKVISGQQLPKPEQQTRGEIIDTYVKVEVHGIPVDHAQSKTRVISNNGFNPVWNETMQFDVRYPPLANIHFRVYDDDIMSRDDFIGQAVIPMTSLQEGYRHVPLRTFGFNAMRNTSIFVQVTISSDKPSLKQRKSRGVLHVERLHPGAKFSDKGRSYIPELDSSYKALPMDESKAIVQKVLEAFENLKMSVGLAPTAHIAETMSELQRLLADHSFKVEETDEGFVHLSGVNSSGHVAFKRFEELEQAVLEFLSKYYDLSKAYDDAADRFQAVLQPSDFERVCVVCGIMNEKQRIKTRNLVEARTYRIRDRYNDLQQIKSSISEAQTYALKILTGDFVKVSAQASNTLTVQAPESLDAESDVDEML